MNDETQNHQPAPLSDEDLSAFLDGEAPDSVAARIAPDQAATDRLEQLAAGSRRVAESTVAPLEPGVVDHLVAAALDAPMAPPAGGRRAPAPWLVAAAIALLVAVGLTLVWSGRERSQEAAFNTVGDRIESESADSSGSDSPTGEVGTGDQSAGSAPDDPPAPATDGTAAETAELVDLGAFASADRLREALATSFAPPSSGLDPSAPSLPMPGEDAVERCAEQLQVTLQLEDPPLQSGTATIDDQRLLVYEFARQSDVDASRTTLVAAVDIESCTPVVLFER